MSEAVLKQFFNDYGTGPMESTLRCNSATGFIFSPDYIHLLLFIFTLSFCLLRDLHAAGQCFWGPVCVPFQVQAAVVGRVHGRGPRWRLALVRHHRRLRQRPEIRALPVHRWGTCSLTAPLGVLLAKQHEQNMITFIITTHHLQECILVYEALPHPAACYARK